MEKKQPIFCFPHDLAIVWDELDQSGNRTGTQQVYYVPFQDGDPRFPGWHKRPFCLQDPRVGPEIPMLVDKGVVLAAIDAEPAHGHFGLACYLLNLAAVKLDERRAQAAAELEQERIIREANALLTQRYKDRLGKDVQIEQLIESYIQDSGN